jgi:hypothetical protein
MTTLGLIILLAIGAIGIWAVAAYITALDDALKPLPRRMDPCLECGEPTRNFALCHDCQDASDRYYLERERQMHERENK